MKDSQLSDPQNHYQTPQSDLEQSKSESAKYGEFKLFSIEGRVGPVRYLIYSLLQLNIFIIIRLTEKMIEFLSHDPTVIVNLLEVVVMIVVGLLSFGLTVQRLHDVNLSGLFILVGWIPLVNIFSILLLYLLSGTHGPNRFGLPNRPIKTWLAYGLILGLILSLVFSIPLTLKIMEYTGAR